MSEQIVQAAGKYRLGAFAPMSAHLNHDVLSAKLRTCPHRMPHPSLWLLSALISPEILALHPLCQALNTESA